MTGMVHLLTLTAALTALLPPRWCCAVGLGLPCCPTPGVVVEADKPVPARSCCCPEPAAEDHHAPARAPHGPPCTLPCCEEQPPRQVGASVALDERPALVAWVPAPAEERPEPRASAW